MFKHYRLRDYDFKLVFLVLAASAIGIIAIGSAKESLQTKQFAGVLLGLFLMIAISLFDYITLLKLYWLMYAGNLVLLFAVIFSKAGDDAGGAQRWLDLGGFRFQPSETAKIILILFFAQFIMKHKERFNTFKYIMLCVLLVAVPWVLIFKQPDLSTSIVVLLVFCTVMFVGGLSYKVIGGILAVVLPTLLIFISLVLQPNSVLVEKEIIKSYQVTRILAFINPEEYASKEAYQQLNAITAIGSGQLDGKGYKTNEISSVKNGNYISEPQTDFIFAVIGEEFGFKGSCLVVIVLMMISLECFSVARKAKDLAGAIIAGGMGGMIIFQSFINIGVATFILPNTGLPLPFISYGLTSLVSLYIGMGFVLNVRLQCKR
ncbi:MAG: FtsW/RodA/SpoVE family cell cycle protein [Lachnospiraceae bacterium]|nr:FtsW/RodA/SpoVE family cell cycle protein [Lachnospiraceae bacterium]